MKTPKLSEGSKYLVIRFDVITCEFFGILLQPIMLCNHRVSLFWINHSIFKFECSTKEPISNPTAKLGVNMVKARSHCDDNGIFFVFNKVHSHCSGNDKINHFFVSLPLLSWMGLIPIHDGNGNGKKWVSWKKVVAFTLWQLWHWKKISFSLPLLLQYEWTNTHSWRQPQWKGGIMATSCGVHIVIAMATERTKKN